MHGVQRLAPTGVAVAGGAALLVTLCALALTAPRWLSVQDRLRECPVVVVLNGDPPFRVEEGARLLHAGYGREVWLTDDPMSSDQAGDAGTRSNVRRLRELGVDTAAIHIVSGAARGTRAELALIAAELTRHGFGCAIAVTSPIHTRRVKLAWAHDVGATPRVVVRHAAAGNYVGWDNVWTELRGIAALYARL